VGFAFLEPIEGFGIGLGNLDRAIKRHGGRIWGDGEPSRERGHFTLS
jgi:hypothetical protein